VQLSGGGRVLVQLRADSSGNFEIHLNGVPGEPLALRITSIGYAPLYGMIRPQDIEENRQYRFALQPAPYRLDDVTVIGARSETKLERTGFEERAARGFGHFIREEEIARRRPHRLPDLLSVVPGLTVIGAKVYVTRGTRFSGPCAPTVWLDGQVVSDGSDQMIFLELVPEDVLGIEVYRGPAAVPVEYAGASAACGVILMWTK
jgi:hypothetical protein